MSFPLGISALLQGGTPLFCLSAAAVHASRWRELDRALFQLKRAYFSREMQGFTARNPDMRPEHYEVKGRQLVKPSHAGSRRNRVFTLKILDLAQQLDVRLFAAVWRKDPANPVAWIHRLTIPIPSPKVRNI